MVSREQSIAFPTLSTFKLRIGKLIIFPIDTTTWFKNLNIMCAIILNDMT